MADVNEIARAKTVYNNLCAALDQRDWKYKRHDDDLTITFGVAGDDLPMDFIFIVDEDRQLLRVFSKLPFSVPEDKRMDLAIATCAATYGLADGSFDYNISKGTIFFRLTTSFRQSNIGNEMFNYLIGISEAVVDDYNDKFFALSKGLLSLEDFLKST